ncbi:FecR family protein [Wenyingzhuangia aestuarii]|uniref:FecR family protein n=1 Tax=Wenyingzhuangia aestuarii TaxID=1647582 RepID=UPI00143B2293|nr:FecR domain-containing protein [Wenyingzhuangia aestuarii]NJB82717.1 hypothetical protein [Wenyingzhuangia aestuarii]
MRKIENIYILAAKVAKSILKNKKVNPDKITELFDEKEAVEILNRLDTIEEKTNRQLKLKSLKKTKNSDWKKIHQQVVPAKKTIRLALFYKVAAVFVGVLGLSYFLTFYSNNNTLHNIATNDAIVLKLGNGKTQIIHTDGSSVIVNNSGTVVSKQIGTSLEYVSANNVETLIYNELTVPFGKTFQVLLSDSTMVHLNSGTTLKYPVKFLKGKERLVYLTGEAYFKVSKDKHHPFTVVSKDINIRVLGTEFNVCSYPEDFGSKTVLVEGSVSLYKNNQDYSKENETLLVPNQKAVWSFNNKEFIIKDIPDTSMYTAWMEGKVVFKHTYFKNIIKKLERHYNVKIQNNNSELAHKKFTGYFDNETIEQVLKAFCKNYKIEYTIKNNLITIN